jgi:hypothetical protein
MFVQIDTQSEMHYIGMRMRHQEFCECKRFGGMRLGYFRSWEDVARILPGIPSWKEFNEDYKED